MSLIAQLTAALPAVLPNDLEQVDADQVSPGVGGFLVVALMAFAVVALVFDLVRRLRRARFRDEIADELAEELAARHADSDAEHTEQGTVSGAETDGHGVK